MIHYTLQIVAFQLLFLLVYDIFLKRETFFNLNRIYLIITPIFALLLPLIKLDILRESIPPKYYIQLPEIFIGKSAAVQNEAVSQLPEITLQLVSATTFYDVLLAIYILGVLVSIVFLLLKMVKFMKMNKNSIRNKFEGVTYFQLPKTDIAFSFLGKIYLGEEINESQKSVILNHEQIHIKQKHSWDLLWFELLRVSFWFNPLIYVFQNRIQLLHEFIADAELTKNENKANYYQNLLSQVFRTSTISFTNTFFNKSLIKNRIIMLQKSKSKKIVQLKYLLVLPLLIGMLFYTSCSEEPANVENQSLQEKIVSLNRDIESKGTLSDEEKSALNDLIFRVLPEGASFVQKMENGAVGTITKNVSEAFDDELNDVPFAVIDQVPLMPGCEGLNNMEAKKCMSDKIQELVAKNFDISIAEKENLTGTITTYVQFKIDKTGKVTALKARAKTKALEEEAKRVVAMLPQMKPGMQKGRAVGVLYALPIKFEIKE